jgi:signal transduction histidine kinase
MPGGGMRVLTARRLAVGAAAASVALMTGSLALAFADRGLVPARLAGWDDVFSQVTDLALPAVGFVLAFRRPRNPIGWLLLAAALALGLRAFSHHYGLHGLVAAPGSWPAARAAMWLSNWIWVIPLAMLAFVFLLFPTGRLRTRRWRPAAWFVDAALALATVGALVTASHIWAHPFPISLRQQGILTVAVTFVALFAALLVSVAALVVRFARSVGEERLQLKWFAAAAVLVLVVLIATFPITSGAVNVLGDLTFLCLFVAIAIAVLKYRLYDIDVVISKAVLYGSLAVFITAVYAALVVGVGTLVGNRRSPLLTALAAAVVAVAFQPARQRAGRLANRVVYGRRATPYQVLSDFAQRIGGTYSAGEVLPQMAHIVAEGTGAEHVVVWLRVGDQLRPQAWSGSAGADLPPVALPLDGQELPSLPGAEMSVPVVHQGQLLGAISLTMPRDEPLRPAGQQLVADVASQAGLVLANTGLIEDLRASRQRLVTAQDEARRRLERNIHDGAQQDLVALGIKLNLAEITVAEDPAQTGRVFGQLKADTAGALENLRNLARGIYPPLLADLGLVAALNAQASKSAVPVTVEADGIGRFGQDTEAAVYFCCLEALQNTAKYAGASQARICLQARGGMLRFTVSDDGSGYDGRHTPMGSGLRNMADRLAALGGRLEVQSARGQGTTITGHLPVPATGGSHQAPESGFGSVTQRA